MRLCSCVGMAIAWLWMYGKYGYFLTCNKKNYKIPEWFPHEKMDLEIAGKYIAYKEKMAKLYSDKGTKKEKSELNVEEESD